MLQTKLARFVFACLFVVVAGFLMANLGFQSAYAGRALPGTKLGNLSLGGKSFSQVRAIVSENSVDMPAVKLSIEGHTIQLGPQEIALRPNASEFAAEVTQTQGDNWLPLLSLLRRPQVTTLGYTADPEKLDSILSSLIAGIGHPATDASVVIASGQVSIVRGQPGLGVVLDAASSTVTDALALGASAVTIDTQSIAPSLTPADLEPVAKELKARMAMNYSFTYQGKKFRPTATEIGSWMSVTKGVDGPQIVINDDRVKAYLRTLGKSINVAAKNKVINTVNGTVQSTEDGANGLELNQSSMTASISQALLAGQGLTVEVPTQVVVFKTAYNRTYNLDYGKYIEVNLTMQHLWVYQDHQVIMDTSITSGQTGNGHGTVQGLFAVYEKQRDRWLDGRPLGYNYDVFVQYWMPFYADYGLHDASWRSSFGGPDYYYHGSHGCVNMPIPAAAWLYGWVDVGTPVFVHT